MKELIVSALKDLEDVFALYGEGYLYRGQNHHYLKNGNVSISTSFSRQGCIPPQMLKWSHYARSVIRAFGGPTNYHDVELEFSQAVLQHYGWRSFYVDLTKSAYVACWFAANKYEERRTIHTCEDLDERGVWLVHKEAEFSPKEGVAHLYIIDTLVLASLNVKVHDLTVLAGDEGILRYSAQQACLAGHLDDVLPAQSIAVHLTVSCEVLKEYYELGGYDTVEKLFPNRKDDFLYNSLLHIPWERFGTETIFPTYRRGLDLPEYDAVYRKRLPSDVVLYTKMWIADKRESSIFEKIPFYKMPELMYYCNSAEIDSLSEIDKILSNHDGFVVELNGIIHIPENPDSLEFEKGVYVRKIGGSLVSVEGLYVEHPGHMVQGIGTFQGWIYDSSTTPWTRVSHEQECPCNNDIRHTLQFSLLNRLNESLCDNEMRKVDSLNYIHKEIDN
ncbi:FRG domain-containing protein [Pseudomonas sp. A1230]|uniref:FRG domain-containing protein n=1 Tax=Pseudomonas sp. A1230 TaxID=3235106 RepID=UPI0037840F4B